MVDTVAPLPVVAAGGLADGRGLAAALMLGAAGITMGTRFLASTAAESSPAEAAALVTARASDTVRTDAFDIVQARHGHPATMGVSYATASRSDGLLIPTPRMPSSCTAPLRTTTTPCGRCGPVKAST